MTGRHASPRKRHRLRTLTLSLAGFLAIAAVAWALIAYTNRVTGSITVGSPEIAYNVGAGVTTSNPACSASFVDAHNMAISWTGFPDETCQLTFAFSESASTNTVAMRLQDVVLDSMLIGTTANCGLTINPGGSATPGASFTIRIDPGATYGSIIDLSAGTYGLYFVDSPSYVAGSCPTT